MDDEDLFTAPDPRYYWINESIGAIAEFGYTDEDTVEYYGIESEELEKIVEKRIAKLISKPRFKYLMAVTTNKGQLHAEKSLMALNFRPIVKAKSYHGDTSVITVWLLTTYDCVSQKRSDFEMTGFPYNCSVRLVLNDWDDSHTPISLRLTEFLEYTKIPNTPFLCRINDYYKIED